MTVTPKRGHWYETRRGDVVAYTGSNFYSLAITHPHMVGFLPYTAEGYAFASSLPHKNDLVKDLGTSDPRPKKPARKPAEKPAKVQPKKFRKVRMYFYRHGHNNVSATDMPGVAAVMHRPGASPIFDLVIDVPVYPSDKTQTPKK